MHTNQLISLATNNLSLLATSITIVLSALYLLPSRLSPELRSLPSLSYVEGWRIFFNIYIMPKQWMKGDPFAFIVDIYRQPKFRPLCITGTNAVLVNDYDAIKEVLAKGMSSYDGRNKTQRALRECVQLGTHRQYDGGCELCISSSSFTVAFGMAELSKYPECQAEVLREVHESLGDAPFADPSNVTPARLAELNYLSNCLHEAIRMYPAAVIVPADVRVDVELCGVTIPKGTRFLCNIRGYSYDPVILPQPETFNPKRWSHLISGSDNDTGFMNVDATDTESMHQGHMAFSLGAHACLGRNLAILELRCVFAMVLERFHVSPKEGFEIETEVMFTLRPKNGVWLQFKERR
ncbi:cytochrome P450 [Endogone sp. FLAS-F59071]|nr:cytochrome P450 [Endogone sp. FLAS-F59071]|eukprot:RUS22709.1 cytochrome P450 [Endogone sp. FLAS-F59071]